MTRVRAEIRIERLQNRNTECYRYIAVLAGLGLVNGIGVPWPKMVLNGGEWLASRFGHFTVLGRAYDILWIGGWIFFRVGFDAVVEGIISAPDWNQTSICTSSTSYERSWDRVVGIAPGYGLSGRGVGVESLWGQEYSSHRPDRFWGLPNLLSNGYRG
jgi:hypothetical protein